MMIHTNTLTYSDIASAASTADVILERCSQEGSRSHSHKWNVILSGNSTRTANFGHDHKSATWDQWGVFLGILFDKDDSVSAGGKNVYPDSQTFHDKTFNRFSEYNRENIDVTSSHSHNWDYSGTPYQSVCNCGAAVRWR